jgi:hypothetical protein
MNSRHLVSKNRRFDLDRVGLNGFYYEPEWTKGHPLDVECAQTLMRVSVALPLGMEFPIFFVSGRADGNARLDITLSEKIANELRPISVMQPSPLSGIPAYG